MLQESEQKNWALVTSRLQLYDLGQPLLIQSLIYLFFKTYL